MRDSTLKLQDKTVFLTGPFNGVTQALMRTMTEFGADVAYVSDSSPNAGRYVNGINEAREVRPHYGRAAFYNLPLTKPDHVSEALGRVAESLGRMDVLIDATPLQWRKGTEEEGLRTSALLADSVLPFLKAKNKGRMVFVFEDAGLDVLRDEPVLAGGVRDRLCHQIQTLAQKVKLDNITVNALAVGVSEDFLVQNFAAMGSIRKSLEHLQMKHPDLRLVESVDVALAAAYLSSALCASLTGQVLHLTHGWNLSQK